MIVLAGVLYVLAAFLTWNLLEMLDQVLEHRGGRRRGFTPAERIVWTVLWWVFALVFLAAEIHSTYEATR